MAVGLDTVVYSLLKKYTDNSIKGITGALAGKNCTIESVSKQDGLTTVTFKWTADDGTVRRNQIEIEDGTPIYTWTSGNHYEYGDLVIYASMFYRCITDNSDTEFDDTKWNELGSPDGNYDIVQSVNLLPVRFTAADRKMYYVINENCFYLWNGTEWVKTISNKIANLDDVNLDELADGDILVWDNVTEKWVNKQALLQYSTMPTASASLEGRVVQFVGETTADFINGSLYKCVAKGTDPESYDWKLTISEDKETYEEFLNADNDTSLDTDMSYKYDPQKYILFYIDDGRSDITDVWDILQEYGIVANIVVPTNMLYTTCKDGRKLVDVLHEMEDTGCEIQSHSVDAAILQQNSTEAQVIHMLKDSKAALVRAGFDVHGFCAPGGGEYSYKWQELGWSHLVRKYYKYSDCRLTIPARIHGKVRSFFSLNATNTTAENCVNAIKNGQNGRSFGIHGIGTDVTESVLRHFIEYALENNCKFITEKEYYTNHVISITEDRLKKIEAGNIEPYTNIDYVCFRQSLGQPPYDHYKYPYAIMYSTGQPKLIVSNRPLLRDETTPSLVKYVCPNDDKFSGYMLTFGDNQWTSTPISGSYVNTYSDASVQAVNYDLYDINGNLVLSPVNYFEYPSSNSATDPLRELDALPTPSALWQGRTFILTADQTGYFKGGIYQCVVNSGVYSWELINDFDPSTDIDFTTLLGG